MKKNCAFVFNFWTPYLTGLRSTGTETALNNISLIEIVEIVISSGFFFLVEV
jgi:hypothetical protein